MGGGRGGRTSRLGVRSEGGGGDIDGLVGSLTFLTRLHLVNVTRKYWTSVSGDEVRGAVGCGVEGVFLEEERGVMAVTSVACDGRDTVRKGGRKPIPRAEGALERRMEPGRGFTL